MGRVERVVSKATGQVVSAAPQVVFDRFKRSKPSTTRRLQPNASFVAQSLNISDQLEQRERERRCILVPGQNKGLVFFDMLMGVALVFTATFTPFEVAFMPSLAGVGAWLQPRFVINRVVDVIFCIDCILQFFIAYDQKLVDHVGPESVPRGTHSNLQRRLP